MSKTQEERRLLKKLASGILDGRVGKEREYRGYKSVYCGKFIKKRSYQNSNNDCKQYRSDIKRVLFSVIGKWHSFIVFRLTLLFRSNHFMFRIRHCHLKIFNGST